MIIDMHFHLDERMMAVETLLDKMDETGIDKVALMAQLVDPLPEPKDILISFAQFLLYHRFTRKIAKPMISKFNENGDIILPTGNFSLYSEPDNEKVFSIVNKYPERFLAWVFVNPLSKNDPAEEYIRWRGSKGFAGVKAHPFWHRYAPVKLAAVAALAAADSKPLLMHAGFDERGDYTALRKELPELKIILAHAGFPRFSDTWRAIKNDKKIFIDFSSNHYVSKKTIGDAVEYLGAERCVFGTDGPFGHRQVDGTMDYGLIKRRIESIFPDKRVQKRILGENFIEIADLKL